MLVEPINATAALTVAKARAGKLLTKTHTRVGDKWTTQPYAKAYRYDLHLVHLKGIPELYSLLERLQGANDACLLLGIPKGGASELMGVPRRTKDREVQGATLEDLGTRFLVFDLDEGIPLEGYADPSDLEGIASHVRDTMLPARFRACACTAQFTASHMIKDGSARLRFIFLADRLMPIKDAFHVMTEGACEGFKADSAVMAPNQPIYTAPPRFEGGSDPIEGSRLVQLAGAPHVAIPDAVSIPARLVEARVALPKVDLSARDRVEPPHWLCPRVLQFADLIGDHAQGLGVNTPAFKAWGSFANYHSLDRAP